MNEPNFVKITNCKKFWCVYDGVSPEISPVLLKRGRTLNSEKWPDHGPYSSGLSKEFFLAQPTFQWQWSLHIWSSLRPQSQLNLLSSLLQQTVLQHKSLLASVSWLSKISNHRDKIWCQTLLRSLDKAIFSYTATPNSWFTAQKYVGPRPQLDLPDGNPTNPLSFKLSLLTVPWTR